MSLSSVKGAVRHVMAMLLVVAFPAGMWAQDAQPAASGSAQASLPQAPSARRPFEVTNYSKPRGYFPNPLAPYMTRSMASPDMTNSPRLDQLMRNGKIYLSMDDAVSLALENNLDIAIQRYNFGIADTDVLRAKAGANGILGVPFGVVQNTPGGGVGGLSGLVGSGPGGTSSASGGIGSGTAGFAGSTEGSGSLITSFDPIVTGTLSWDRGHSVANNVFSGAPIVSPESPPVTLPISRASRRERTCWWVLITRESARTAASIPTAPVWLLLPIQTYAASPARIRLRRQ